MAGSSIRAQTEADDAQRWLEQRDPGPLAKVWRRGKTSLIRRLNRLNAPIVYPWSPSHSGTGTAHALHRAAAALLRQRVRNGWEQAWLWTKAVTWPVVAILAAGPLWHRCGRVVRERHGIPLREQWRDLFDALWNHGVFPTEYYHHGVFRSAAHTDHSRYLSEREIIALLAGADRGSDTDRLDTWRRFHAECREAGVPVPRLLAVFQPGMPDSPADQAEALPGKDLFVRPEQWEHGEQGSLWRWNAQAQGWSNSALTLRAADLLAHCRRLAEHRVILLQEYVHNHPELARFSAGGLCTVRVATACDAHGEPQALFAQFRLPGAGGSAPLSAGVDVRDGRLTAAVGEFVSDGEFDTHPGTGALITGAALPHWQALTELVLRAHRRFADIPFIGWEIALGGSGPMILEATTNWGVFPHVLPAETAFGTLCLQRLETLRRADLRVHPLTRPLRQPPVERSTIAATPAARQTPPR